MRAWSVINTSNNTYDAGSRITDLLPGLNVGQTGRQQATEYMYHVNEE